MNIQLKKTIDKDGQKINVLTLDLEKLTGADLCDAEDELFLRGSRSSNPLFTSLGSAVVAAKASGMLTEDILTLGAQDFMRVSSPVKNFLYEWVLEDGQP